MVLLSRKAFNYYNLILLLFLQITLSSCSNIQSISRPFDTTSSKGKMIDYIETKNYLISNLSIQSSSNRDLQFALQQFNQSRFEVAEFYLKKTLVKFPGNPTAIRLLPWTYFYQKHYDRALKTFKRTKTLLKKNPEALVGMGWCYFALRNYEKAIEQFKSAKKINGNLYHINKGEGFAHLKLNKIAEAKENFSKIYSTSQINSIFELWTSWHQKDTNVLINILPTSTHDISLFTLPLEFPRYQSLLMGFQNETDPHINIAWNAFSKGKYKKALDIFEDLHIDDRSPDIKNGIAWSLLKNKEIKESNLLFRQILKKWPNFLGATKGIDELEKTKRKQALHADHYFNIKKLGIAEKKYYEIKNRYPNWEYPYTQLGKLKLAQKNYLYSREYFLDALDLAPNDKEAKAGIEEVRKVIDASLYQADLALKSGDYKKAAILYADYIDEYKPKATSFLNLHKTLSHLGFLDSPWREYSIEQKPRKPSFSLFSKVMSKLGLINSTSKNTPPAIPSSGTSLAHAYNGLGWSQYHKKKYLQAAEKFKIARTDREYSIESSRGLGLSLYEAGQFRRAANTLKFVTKLNPDQNLVYKLDMSILMGWDVASAREYFSKNLVHYPLRSSLYMGLGWLNYKDKNQDLAIEYFLKAISLDPNFALTDEFKTLLAKERFGWQVYNRFGWAYYDQLDYTNAILMFKNSLREQPNKSESRKGMGYALNKVGKLSEAAKYLSQALELNNDPNPVTEIISGDHTIAPYSTITTARTTLGNIILKQGKPYEAIELFQEELEFRPNLAVAQDGLGWSYLKLNQLTQSRTAFKNAIKNQPLNYLTHKGLKEVKQKIANNKLQRTLKP
jgi:tetratricopeptide (TPR) repeat protein